MRVLHYRKYDKKAEISIFISLLCISVCAFIYVVIESAKMNAVMYRMEALTDIAVRSCFSEYCKPLLDEYGLLYVDTAYKSEYGGSSSFLNHIAAYITVNTYVDGMNFTNIDYVDGIITNAIYASDNDYSSLKKQIIYVMRYDGYVGTDRELIQEYINKYFNDVKKENINDMDNDEYDDIEKDLDVYELSEDELLYMVANLITNEMKAIYSEHFNINNLLESCDITIVLNGNGKEYEKNINYSLFVQ